MVYAGTVRPWVNRIKAHLCEKWAQIWSQLDFSGIPLISWMIFSKTTMTILEQVDKNAFTMDPWTLSHFAGHRDMTITRRYIHPQPSTILDAMEKARNAQSGHSDETKPEAPKVGVAVIN